MNDQPDQRPDPAQLAQLDQTRANVADLARIVSSYFKALVTEGVPIEAATQLTLGYQANMIWAVAHTEVEEEGE